MEENKVKNELLKLPLQFFAEGGDPKPEGEADPQENEAGGAGQEIKTLTQAEVDAVVEKRLNQERKRFQQELEAQVTEAQKLAKMNAEEKAKYETKQKEKALAEREADITKRELTAQAKEKLADDKLPLSLATILDYTSAEACQSSLEAVKKAFEEAVTAAVDDRLRQDPPNAGGKNNSNAKPTTFEDALKEHYKKELN